MTDIISPEARSRNMSAIRSKNTKPEVYLRHLLFMRGYRYRNNVSNVIGHPDLYMAKYNTAIFINGCFWHRHPGCRYAYTPKSNIEFWNRKFESNVYRDRTVRESLKECGIRQIIIWECTVKKMRSNGIVQDQKLREIEDFLHGSDQFLEL